MPHPAVATPPSPREVVERLIRSSADNAWHDLADLYAMRVDMAMPFAPAGIPRRATEERENLRARFEAAGRIRRFHRADSVVIHETHDPEVVIAEFTLHGSTTADPRSFEHSYIMVVTVRNGQIISSRDYSNPLASSEVYGPLTEAAAGWEPA